LAQATAPINCSATTRAQTIRTNRFIMKLPLRLETIPLSYWSKAARATLTRRNDRWSDDRKSH
jgi:hypothetical protein